MYSGTVWRVLLAPCSTLGRSSKKCHRWRKERKKKRRKRRKEVGYAQCWSKSVGLKFVIALTKLTHERRHPVLPFDCENSANRRIIRNRNRKSSLASVGLWVIDSSIDAVLLLLRGSWLFKVWHENDRMILKILVLQRISTWKIRIEASPTQPCFYQVSIIEEDSTKLVTNDERSVCPLWTSTSQTLRSSTMEYNIYIQYIYNIYIYRTKNIYRTKLSARIIIRSRWLDENEELGQEGSD